MYQIDNKYRIEVISKNRLHIHRLSDDKEKIVLVTDDPEWTVKILKTRVKANGGAEGLFKYIKRAYEEDFCTVIARNIMENILDMR